MNVTGSFFFFQIFSYNQLILSKWSKMRLCWNCIIWFTKQRILFERTKKTKKPSWVASRGLFFPVLYSKQKITLLTSQRIRKVGSIPLTTGTPFSSYEWSTFLTKVESSSFSYCQDQTSRWSYTLFSLKYFKLRSVGSTCWRIS